MKPLPLYIREARGRHSALCDTINDLIDHLTDYEAEMNRRLTELDNRIQEISNLQLEMSRDFKARLLELGKEI